MPNSGSCLNESNRFERVDSRTKISVKVESPHGSPRRPNSSGSLKKLPSEISSTRHCPSRQSSIRLLTPAEYEEQLSREDQEAAKHLGVDVKLEWTESSRQFLKYTRLYRLPRRAPSVVDVEVDLEKELFLGDEDQETNVRIALTGVMNTISKLPRIPLNIICVVDKSDSMTGDKMGKAKQAMTTILETLQPGDRCTIVAFSSDAEVVVPSFDKGTKSLTPHLQKVNDLQPKGNTNMTAALAVAASHAKRAYAGNRVNRVILITDGHPTKREGLMETVTSLAQLQVFTTSIGVGEDFNEDFLAELADSGQGAYYFADDSKQMEEMVKKELSALENVVAKGASVILMPRDNVNIEEVTGYQMERVDARTVMVGIGDVVANKKLEVLARLTYRLPPGTHDLLEVQVRYQDATTETHIQSSVLTANFVKDAVDAQAAAPVGVVVEKVNKIESALALREAALAFSTEGVVKGQELLRRQSQKLMQSLSGSEALRAIGEKMNGFASAAENPDAKMSLLKKSVKEFARNLERE